MIRNKCTWALAALIAITTSSTGIIPSTAGANEIDTNNGGEHLRVDCRYHNSESIPHVNFCYASAIYLAKDHTLEHIRFGVGCDYQTIYNDRGSYFPIETISDRISPSTAATPAIEVTPSRSLFMPGTYPSTLDIYLGRLIGTCYVHPVFSDLEMELGEMYE